LATLSAAVPPALALGPGAESRIPLAITVIGGVIVSTFFTLLVVPCAYSLMVNLEGKSHPEAELYAHPAPAPMRPRHETDAGANGSPKPELTPST
jgi:hypothetical protein